MPWGADAASAARGRRDRRQTGGTRQRERRHHVNGPREDPIRRFLAARVAEGRMAGAAWWVGLVTRDGPLSSGAVGWAVTVPRREAIGAATPFDLASLTKPLATATLLVLLEQEGRLDLGSPVGEQLSEIAATPLGGASLVDLARHAAGLPAWQPLYLAASGREEYARRIAALPRAVAPGATLYSDLGYILLGFVLERVGGAELPRLFESRIAAPLALGRTGFAVAGRGYSDAAATEAGNAYERGLAGPAGAGHRWREHVLRGEVHDANAHALGGAAGHAGLFGAAPDVARLAQEILGGSRLGLDAAARRRLLGVGPGGRTVGWLAAAWSAAARAILPARAPGHTGFTGTSVWLDPERGAVFVLLSNRVHPTVPEREFTWVRRGFHRLATRLAASSA